MLRPVAEFIDAYRIWHKVTFQRGRILATRDGAWESFDREDHFTDPESFFGAAGRVAAVELMPSTMRRGIEVASFRFPSLHPIRGYPYEETNTAWGRIYGAGRPEAPVVILSHGWAHDDLRGLEVIFVEPLLAAGYDVAVPSHAFHFKRTPKGTYSGEMMVSGDVVLTVEAFRQSVADLLGLAAWLRESGRLRVGILGYSLGGYVGALAACLTDRLDFAVLAAAGDSVISPILETGLGANVREDLSRSQMHREENLRRAWGVISPGRLRPRIPRERILLMAGQYDRIMLRSSVDRLWEGWGRPAIQWHRQGHYSLLAVPGRVARCSLPFLSERTRPASRSASLSIPAAAAPAQAPSRSAH